jgi:hypothetical protein
MLLTQPEELKQDLKFQGLIYGQPGIGKSTLALSAPNPVMVDAEKGMKRVEARLRVPSLQVESYEQILELLKSPEIAPFETVVFDTMGRVLELMEPYLIKQNPKNAQSNGALSLGGYKARKIEFNNLLKLVRRLNKSILFVAHEKEEKTGEDKIVRPDVAGSSGAELIKDLDFVGYMEAKGTKRTISFFPTEKYYAKNSLQLDEVIEVPDTKDGNTFISERIVNMTKEKMERQAELITQYNEVLAKGEQIILNMQCPNEAIKQLGELNEVWDSKKRLFKSLKEEAKKLGYEYKNKAFIIVEQQNEEVIPNADTIK